MASVSEPILKADELLLIVCEHNGKQFLRDSNAKGEFGGFDFISTWLDDEVVEVRKANAETWAVKDITEDCARQWLIAADEDGSLDYDEPDTCEQIMPLYVKQSKAWARWMDDPQAEKPVNVSAMYGTYSATNGHAA